MATNIWTLALALAGLGLAVSGCMGGTQSITSCGSSESCTLTCDEGAFLAIRVTGTGPVSGSFSCGGVTVGCSGEDTCDDVSQERVPAGGDGTCSKTQGSHVDCDVVLES